MGIVDYLSRDPFNDPWPESELDEKFVVATKNSFLEAFDCRNSRLKETGSLNRNKNVLEYSRRNAKKQSSSNGCYSNQNGQKRTKLDRNEKKKQFSRLQKQLNTAAQLKQITFLSNQPNKQSVSNNSKIVKQPVREMRKKKTDSRNEMSGNTSYDWWSDSPQEWRNEEREESLMDSRWNRSISNTNELSEEEEITETVQRKRKII